jgi:HD-like signal output (HDOD) protein
MLQTFDDYHDLLIKGITDGWEDISELERLKYHTSHTTLGALLAQQWQLPKAMIDVIYYFHDTEGIFNSGELSRVGLYLLAILKLSRSSVDGILRGDSNTKEWLLLEDHILEFLEIDEIQLEDMREKVINAFNEEE